MEHAQIDLNVGWFPHSVMHRPAPTGVGVSFRCAVDALHGERICRARNGNLSSGGVLFTPVGSSYSGPPGQKYAYTEEQRQVEPGPVPAAAERYRDLLGAGFAEGNMPGASSPSLPPALQWSVSPAGVACTFSILARPRPMQLGNRQLCDLNLAPSSETGAPEFAALVREKAALHKARLAP